MVVGCQPYAPAASTPRKCSWYSFLLEAELTPGPYCDRKDFMSMKNPLTTAGIEPATHRFVAQHLNHCATVVPFDNKPEVKFILRSHDIERNFVYPTHRTRQSDLRLSPQSRGEPRLYLVHAGIKYDST